MGEAISSLRVMYRMERLATQLYRTQIHAFRGHEIADSLGAAAANEQEHVDILTERIEELGGTPSRAGIFYQMAGTLLGFTTIILGKVVLLKIDLFIERRAVRDYDNFLQKVDFDEKSVALLNKILADEKRHVETWDNSIKILKGRR
jgi:bacterioferritin